GSRRFRAKRDPTRSLFFGSVPYDGVTQITPILRPARGIGPAGRRPRRRIGRRPGAHDLRHGIVTRAAPRVAATDSPQREPRPARRAEAHDPLLGVDRAGRDITSLPPEPRPSAPPAELD